MGIPSVLFVIIGSMLTAYFESFFLDITLGIFLILLSLLFLLQNKLKVHPNKTHAFLGGSLSGFIAGLLGTGGAIRGLTMAAFNLEKSVFIATSAIIDFGVDLSRGLVYYYNGYMHSHDMIYLPVLLLIGFVGSYIGKQILTKISQENFKKGSLLLILFIGIVTLIKVW